MTIYDFINRITSGVLDAQLKMLYGSSERNVMKHRARYLSAAENFSRLYPECTEINIFSVGSAAILGGGSAESRNSKILATAIDKDIIAISAISDEDEIRFAVNKSEEITVDMKNTMEKQSVITRLIGYFTEKGRECRGFNAYISSEITDSIEESPAFGIIMGMMLDSSCEGERLSGSELAKIVDDCGNIESMVCAGGGLWLAENSDTSRTDMKKIGFDFSGTGYKLCITTPCSTESLRECEYSAESVSLIAKELEESGICDIDEELFYESISLLREKFSDKEILNTIYFLDEERYIAEGVESLENGDTEGFFECICESGECTARFIQNSCCSSDRQVQSLLLAVALSERLLGGCGAVMIRNTALNGEVTAFVPGYLADEYVAEMEKFFGKSSCMLHNFRNAGCYVFE